MAVKSLASWEEAWSWWSGLANFETRPALPGELKLGRMLGIMSALGDPHLLPRIIHVAGTKGKGSIAAMVESVLRHAGLRTALYTSPHLSHVTERFRFGADPVAVEELAAAVLEVREVVGAIDSPLFAMGPPTFFEVATAAAFVLFARKKTEFAVLEVGLGGRLDSTNICQPACCVISTIGLDHTKILGDTLELIAQEKAGIVKPGVPVISGVIEDPAREVVRSAARNCGSILWEWKREIEIEGEEIAWWEKGRVQTVNVRTPAGTYAGLPCPLPGKHQWQNLACAVGVIDMVLGDAIPDRWEVLKKGLQATKWPGRLEVLGRDPLTIFDGAHNLDSAAALAREIGRIPLLDKRGQRGQRRFIVSISSDKDQEAILRQWAPLADEMILTRYTSGQRATPPETLLNLMSAHDRSHCRIIDHAGEALETVLKAAAPDDQIIVTGSLFLVGELRPLMREKSAT